MATFKDDAGRDWELHIDAPTILRLRQECDPKFMLDSAEENTFARLADDPVLLCGVLFALCKKQREERGISDEDFYRALGGDAIENATEAFQAAYLNFTPRRQRELLELGAAKTDKIRQLAIQKAMDKINDPALEAALLERIDAKIDELLGELTPPKAATDSPGSSEFTHAV